MTVKVADFGLARDIYTDSYYASATKKKPLPIKWLAPEALLDRMFTEKTDVVSVKMLLLKQLTLMTIYTSSLAM